MGVWKKLIPALMDDFEGFTGTFCGFDNGSHYTKASGAAGGVAAPEDCGAAVPTGPSSFRLSFWFECRNIARLSLCVSVL